MSLIQAQTVSIQGQMASFSQQASKKICSPQQFLQRNSFAEVFEDLIAGRADLIVVPIENSTYGSVYENYDNLSRYPIQIVAETYIRVGLDLLGVLGSNLEMIKKVYSHQVALDQIQNFRQQNRQIQFLPYYDTAGAAKLVKELADPTIAACAGRLAAETYNLKIIQESIEDSTHNLTRFFAIKKKQATTLSQIATKTTIQFELGEEAGSLYKTLRSFADRNLALSRIESRPIINTTWSYRFYLDISSGLNSDQLKYALAEMKDYVKDQKVIILGSYYSVD